MSGIDWRERVLDRMPPDLAEEIDIFEGQMELRRQGKIEDRVFAETRLRRGVYGQRYDNGHRHDGLASQQLVFPAGDLTKGPETLWDAPGHGAHQGALRRHHARSARRHRRAGRGVLGRDPPHHHPPGRAAPLRAHRRHGRPHAPAGGGGHHHPRSVRQRRPQPHRLPARRRLPHRGLRHHGLRGRPLPLPARPPRLPGLRAQVQAGLLRVRGRGLRPGDDARLRRASPARPWSTASSAARSTSTSAAAWAPPRTRRSCSTRTTPSRSCSPRCSRSPASSDGWARRPTATGRASSSWSRSSASTSSAAWWTRSASMLPYDERWTSYLPSVEDFTESPIQESVPRPPSGTDDGRRATRTGSRPTCTASARPDSRSPPSRCRSAT